MALGLDSTQSVLDAMGNPERSLAAIHVAGSNGKGTTCAMLTAGLVDAGQCTGTFTSPHVARIEERIRIDGRTVSAEEFDLAMETVRDASGEIIYQETVAGTPWQSEKKTQEQVTKREEELGWR